MDRQQYWYLCFEKLCPIVGGRRKPSKAARGAAAQVASYFIGSKASYRRRVRKICFAKVADGVREIEPQLGQDRIEAIAAATLNSARDGKSTVTGEFSFKRSWDLELIKEVGKYRRHNFEVEKLNSTDDIKQQVTRYLDSEQLCCRRQVKRWILSKRYYASYYAKVEAVRAIDCSFKYTGSAYAFVKTARSHASLLATLCPEIFFKKAGQLIRQRKYAAWLRENDVRFEDMGHSIQRLAAPEVAKLGSWSALEEHSRRWHEVQYKRAHPEIDATPFGFPEELPRSFEHKGYSFSVLKNPLEVMKEGQNMRHCVVNYASRVMDGEYVVYKAEGHQERATVGLGQTPSGLWVVDQARGRFNGKVSARLMKAAQVLVKQIPKVPTAPKRDYREDRFEGMMPI
jgi:hypothetical protein